MEDNKLDSRFPGNDTIHNSNDEERNKDSAKALEITDAPQSKEELHAYVKEYLGLDVPRVSICSGHCAPMDYLWHAYSADKPELPDALSADESADCIVWAGRGGHAIVPYAACSSESSRSPSS